MIHIVKSFSIVNEAEVDVFLEFPCFLCDPRMLVIWSGVPLLLLLSHFSRVQLCATPQTSAHQAPPCLGFSRQEHWSGSPFPFPMKSDSEVNRVQLLATQWTAAYQAPRSMGFSRQEYWSGVPLPSPWGSSAFSKSSLYIWNFSVHVLLKPSLKDLEHYLSNIFRYLD